VDDVDPTEHDERLGRRFVGFDRPLDLDVSALAHNPGVPRHLQGKIDARSKISRLAGIPSRIDVVGAIAIWRT